MTLPSRRVFLSLFALIVVIGFASVASAQQKLWVYFGTYTGKESKGIYRFEMDTTTGKLTELGVTEGVSNPSFVALHPTGKYLYAVAEVGNFESKPGGGVAAFQIDPSTGDLKLLNSQSTVGGGPCFVEVDPSGKCALVANYGGGSVACLPIEADGKLKEASSFIQHKGHSVLPRQKAPHAHSIRVDAGGKFAVSADLGLDKLLVYKLDAAAGKLTPNDPPSTSVKPGSGPRHFAFHPNGKYAYVIDEISLTVTAFTWDARRGVLTGLQEIPTLPAGADKKGSTAEIVVHPSGKFLYGSNRGHDSIVMYRIDPATGKLTALGNESTRGKTPRNFNVDPSGNWLIACNQGTSNVQVFRIDTESGTLSAVGDPVKVPTPVCVKFLPQQ